MNVATLTSIMGDSENVRNPQSKTNGINIAQKPLSGLLEYRIHDRRGRTNEKNIPINFLVHIHIDSIYGFQFFCDSERK